MNIKNNFRVRFVVVVSAFILIGAGAYMYKKDLMPSLALASCTPGQFCSGAVSPTSVPAGGHYTVSCNYGYAGNGVYPVVGSGSCTYKSFSGTTAEFDCVAGTVPGTFNNSCKISSPSPYSSKQNSVNALTVLGAPVSVAAPLIPSNAIAVSGLQNSPNWSWQHDANTPGASNGSSQMVSTPWFGSASSREFYTTYAQGAGQRFHLTYGNDPTATHFVYDVWINVADPANVQNIELDNNQVLANGDTVIYGTQCASGSKTWEYTEVTGANTSHWLPSNIYCNPTTWTANTWHHVQIAYQRDGAGNVTYDWVNLDGTVSYFKNATVNSAFSLGWAKGTLLINLQLDGLGNSGSITAYAADWTMWRW